MNTNTIPRLMSIRAIAQTGLMPEYALRMMHKRGELPGIKVGNKKFLVNYDKLLAQLNAR